MKKMFSLFILIGSLASQIHAAEFGTPEEAVAMVKKAVAYAKRQGREKALEEINNPKGRFVDRDLYVTAHDLNGKVLANPLIPRMVGKNAADLKDVDGKAFVKERLDMLRTSDSGWIDFKWPNSVTSQVEKRSTYFEKADDLVFTCGILKN
jgi:signal transduction histidine kinase